MLLSGIVFSCVLLSSGGCKPSPRDGTAEGFGTKPASLKGTYGLRRGAEIEPVLKVEEIKAGGYTFEERATGEWSADPETPHTATTADFVKSFGGTTDVPVYGLATRQASVYKVPEGWSRGGFRTGTGYILITDAGPVELVKILRD